MTDVHKKCCQILVENQHNDYTFELPTEKLVANVLATEEPVCAWRALCAAQDEVNLKCIVVVSSIEHVTRNQERGKCCSDEKLDITMKSSLTSIIAAVRQRRGR